MNSRTGVFILVGALLLVFGVFFLVNNQKGFKWYETYEENDENPYGSYALLELLKKSAEVEIINTQFDNKKFNRKKNASYVFVGSDLPLDSNSAHTLLQFVAKGNKAFIATNTAPYSLFQYLDDCAYEIDGQTLKNFVVKSTIRSNFVGKGLRRNAPFKFEHVLKNRPEAYRWTFLDSSFFCGNNLKIIPLGVANDSLVNFYQVKHGKGSFYFHTNPILFTNYFLLKQEGLEYIEKVFSNFQLKTYYWDEFHKKFSFNMPGQRVQTPLKFILGNAGLRNALYLLLILITVYLIFFSKRKQRIIPILEQNENTSIEYTETIGKLYFRQQNHKNLCVHKMKFFLGYIRDRYNLSTNNIDTDFLKKLNLKSQIPYRSIEVIFSQYRRITTLNEIADDTLIDFHQTLEYFYQNCK